MNMQLQNTTHHANRYCLKHISSQIRELWWKGRGHFGTGLYIKRAFPLFEPKKRLRIFRMQQMFKFSHQQHPPSGTPPPTSCFLPEDLLWSPGSQLSLCTILSGKHRLKGSKSKLQAAETGTTGLMLLPPAFTQGTLGPFYMLLVKSPWNQHFISFSHENS